MATVKQIFEAIQVINAASTSVSSMGQYISDTQRMAAEYAQSEIMQYLPESSLAYKIVKSTERYSTKQLWVVAYELLKNAEYCAKLDAKNEEAAAMKAAKKAKSSAKLAANKEASADVLAKVKASGKLLKDYYSFLKTSEYKREFYSKKYSEASVEAFLAK